MLLVFWSHLQLWIYCIPETYIHRVWKKVPFYFFLPQLCQILTDLQNSFIVTLSSKFAIKKSLYILPSFTRVATLPCKTVVLKNRTLRLAFRRVTGKKVALFPDTMYIIHLYSPHNMIAQANKTGTSKNTTNEKKRKK